MPCREMLVKLYDVPRQHTLPGNKRRGNVFGIFATAEEFSYLDGKTILLADDIKTTGSTLSECAKMLKNSRRKEVCAVTAAIAKKDRITVWQAFAAYQYFLTYINLRLYRYAAFRGT